MKSIFLSVLCVLLMATVAMASGNLWVDTNDGDDSNTGLNEYDPLKTFNKAIVLGAATVDTGVKIVYGSELPTVEEAQAIMGSKLDLVLEHATHEFISGHGELPLSDTSSSTISGLQLVKEYQWEVFMAPNGQWAERMIGETEVVKEY